MHGVVADEVVEILLLFHQIIDQSLGLPASADFLRKGGFA